MPSATKSDTCCRLATTPALSRAAPAVRTGRTLDPLLANLVYGRVCRLLNPRPDLVSGPASEPQGIAADVLRLVLGRNESTPPTMAFGEVKSKATDQLAFAMSRNASGHNQLRRYDPHVRIEKG